MDNYEEKARAAQERLQYSIYRNVNLLFSNLINQSEVFPDYEEEFRQLSSIETVQENQYRLFEYDSNCIHIVKVASIDQDDEDAENFSVVEIDEFARWVYVKHYAPDRMAEFIADLKSKPSTFFNDFFKACDFNDSDDREALFESADLHPSNVADIEQYLKDTQDGWSPHFTLLNEGEDAETTDREVLEHWLVDDYAKHQLESIGERVVEVLDLLVWCRTTTGQSFWYDACMQQLGAKYLAEQSLSQ